MHTWFCYVEYPPPLELSSREIFSADSIAVHLEWKKEPGVTYTASIIPPGPVPLLTSTESTMLQLMLSYNEGYNVSITSTLCGQNSDNTTLTLSYGELQDVLQIMILYFLDAGKCLDTFHEGFLHSADRNVFLKGTNITFSCPPGLVLSGPNTSTCMENGEWEPTSEEVECKG